MDQVMAALYSKTLTLFIGDMTSYSQEKRSKIPNEKKENLVTVTSGIMLSLNTGSQ
jgi:hypothetical protein